MRSPADGSRGARPVRLLAERALRVTAVVAVSAWIWLAMRPGAAVEVTRESGLTDALARWTLTPTYSVHVRLDTVPDARSRDWLAALRRAGTGVSWWTDAIGAVAVETYAATEPAGGAVVLAATPARLSDSVSGTLPAVAILSDDLGPLDTVAVGHNPSLVRLGDPGARVTLTSGAQPAPRSSTCSLACEVRRRGPHVHGEDAFGQRLQP